MISLRWTPRFPMGMDRGSILIWACRIKGIREDSHLSLIRCLMVNPNLEDSIGCLLTCNKWMASLPSCQWVCPTVTTSPSSTKWTPIQTRAGRTKAISTNLLLIPASKTNPKARAKVLREETTKGIRTRTNKTLLNQWTWGSIWTKYSYPRVNSLKTSDRRFSQAAKLR